MTYIKDTIIFQPLPTSSQFRNLTGQIFGQLTVLGYAGWEKGSQWVCECSCGNITKVRASSLTCQNTRSCGCFRPQNATGPITHGEARSVNGRGTAEYKAYLSAKARCNNPNTIQYTDYGGRGIEFCFESYPEFLQELGRKPTPQHSLDRIDTNGHYEKGNVRWATIQEQRRNKRNNHIVVFQGKSQCIAAWAEEVGLPSRLIQSRLKLGWGAERALYAPIRGRQYEQVRESPRQM